MSDEQHLLRAYEIHPPRDMPIEPAPAERGWMEAGDRFPYRCLPMVIANQHGWFVRNPATFTASWNGGPRREDVLIDFPADDAAPDAGAPPGGGVFTCSIDAGVFDTGPSGHPSAAAGPPRPRENRITSHFGYGVVTISLPYLFRTPDGVNLWVKGPSNWIKDGAQALEGIVETDWCPATFTMNWKLTRPGYTVRFDKGEPICMLVPVPRGLAESLQPVREPLAANPELEAAYRHWQDNRTGFLVGLAEREQATIDRGWEKDYFKGLTADGRRAAAHQTRLHLKPFRRP